MRRFALILDNGQVRQCIGYVRAANAAAAWQRLFRVAKLGTIEFFVELGCSIDVERANAHDVADV